MYIMVIVTRRLPAAKGCSGSLRSRSAKPRICENRASWTPLMLRMRRVVFARSAESSQFE
jgi:hypothetical protein